MTSEPIDVRTGLGGERQRVRSMIERSGVVTLMNTDQQGRYIGRPMLPLFLEHDPHVYFLTHQSSRKVGQVTTRPQRRGFAGRGPKGYQRSDERIKEQLSDRLMDDDDIDATEIAIEVKSGEVTLTGTVNSREEKRAAEDIAEQLPGVREVQNHLRVSHDALSAQFGQSGQTGRTAMSASSSRQESTSKSGDSTSGQSKSRNERE